MSNLSLKQFEEKVKALENELISFDVKVTDDRQILVQKIALAKELQHGFFSGGSSEGTVDYKQFSIECLKHKGDSHYLDVTKYVGNSAREKGQKMISNVTINQFLNQCVANKQFGIVKIRGRRGVFGIRDGEELEKIRNIAKEAQAKEGASSKVGDPSVTDSNPVTAAP